MTQLTTSNLIKAVVATLIIIVVLIALYFAFKNYIIPWFKGINIFGADKLILSLLK